MGAAEPERFLEGAGSVLEQQVDLVGVVKVVATKDSFMLLAIAPPLDLYERVGE